MRPPNPITEVTSDAHTQKHYGLLSPFYRVSIHSLSQIYKIFSQQYLIKYLRHIPIGDFFTTLTNHHALPLPTQSSSQSAAHISFEIIPDVTSLTPNSFEVAIAILSQRRPFLLQSTLKNHTKLSTKIVPPSLPWANTPPPLHLVAPLHTHHKPLRRPITKPTRFPKPNQWHQHKRHNYKPIPKVHQITINYTTKKSLTQTLKKPRRSLLDNSKRAITIHSHMYLLLMHKTSASTYIFTQVQY